MLWWLASLLLAGYVRFSDGFGATYGPLTAIMALLLWANLTGIALFLGLAFAAQLEAPRVGVRRPALEDRWEPGPAPRSASPVYPRSPPGKERRILDRRNSGVRRDRANDTGWAPVRHFAERSVLGLAVVVAIGLGLRPAAAARAVALGAAAAAGPVAWPTG